MPTRTPEINIENCNQLRSQLPTSRLGAAHLSAEYRRGTTVKASSSGVKNSTTEKAKSAQCRYAALGRCAREVGQYLCSVVYTHGQTASLALRPSSAPSQAHQLCDIITLPNIYPLPLTPAHPHDHHSGCFPRARPSCVAMRDSWTRARRGREGGRGARERLRTSP